MKQIKLLLLFTFASAVSASAQNRRYFDEVFSSVTVTANVTYAVNATVLYLAPPPNGVGQAIPEQIRCNIYEPEGDTETARPLIIMMHTGNFLPPQVNGGCTGTRFDASDVEMATRLAKMGYVVACADYRLGWNPIASTQTERVYTLINAAYRGVQDSRTCIRFFRKEASTYKIDTEKITLWGIGAGGYISLASATLDTITDTYIPKFLTPQGPMVIELLSGDLDGTKVGFNPGIPGLPYPTGDTLCYPNHVGYSSDFALAVNLGGALGDTSWIDENDVPMISYHNPTDPFAPCGTGIVLVPPPLNLPVVEVSGSCTAQEYFTAYGVQSAIVNANFSDQLSLHAESINGGLDAFYPFLGNDSSPWAFSANANPYNLGTSPNCETFAATHDAYIDTIMRYFAPRACAVLGLSPDCKTIKTTELSTSQVGMAAVPNPTMGDFILKSDARYEMQNIEIVDVAGRVCARYMNVNNTQFEVKRGNLAAGIYFARVQFKEGFVTQKIIMN
ncbi:MAG: T9SS type A sorting domain-containing protein [Saprospiraceae bacterium]|nr:T9SS type A sorting domain-containing protein [Saprospiraceae bacterium]